MDGQIAAEHFSRYLFVSHYLDLGGKKVLDIASGAGYGSYLLAQKAGQVTGVDISQETVDYANSHYKRENLTFQQGSCYEIPLPADSVDVVVSFETLEHIDRQEDFLSELERVLRPDGIVVISSPNKRLYTDVPNKVNPYHVKELYNEEFLALVNQRYRYTEYLGQNYLLSSVIYPINGAHPSAGRPAEYADNDFREKEPLYNILIASNAPLSTLRPLPAAFFYEDTVTIDNIRKAAFNEGQNSCRNTHTWKIGHFLLTPFRFFRHLFSH